MDIFDKHYYSYRTVLKIIGLWPYNNSIYVWIQRLWISALFLGNIIFQVTKILVCIILSGWIKIIIENNIIKGKIKYYFGERNNYLNLFKTVLLND